MNRYLRNMKNWTIRNRTAINTTVSIVGVAATAYYFQMRYRHDHVSVAVYMRLKVEYCQTCPNVTPAFHGEPSEEGLSRVVPRSFNYK